MKSIYNVSIFILAVGILIQDTSAAVSINNFNITTTSISFQINGTMPSAVPDSGANSILLVNQNLMEDPGFVIGEFRVTSFTFTGSQATLSANTAGSFIGDYAYFLFNFPFAAGESLSGTLTASWPAATFDPGAVSNLNVFWGLGIENTVTSGTLLAVVPEPASPLLGAFSGLALLCRRRRAS